MKPFDLEKALAGEPVVTRDGRPVHHVTHFPELRDAHNVLAVIEGNLATFNRYGGYFATTESSHDLFMAPVKQQGWVIVYPDTSGYMAHLDGRVFATEKGARHAAACAGGNAIGVVSIEWEE